MSDNVEYAIDGADLITEVNESWNTFARNNAGDGLLSPGILGHSLWDYIGDEGIRQIYRQLFARIRNGSGPVSFAFRCDSPTRRRLLRLQIAALPDAGLQFTVSLHRAEDRPAVALVDTGTPRSSAMIRMCAWCKRIPAENGEWLEVEAALQVLDLFGSERLPIISHGICDECRHVMETVLTDSDS